VKKCLTAVTFAMGIMALTCSAKTILDINGDFKMSGGKELPAGWRFNSAISKGKAQLAAGGGIKIKPEGTGQKAVVYSCRFQLGKNNTFRVNLKGAAYKLFAGFYLYDSKNKWFRQFPTNPKRLIMKPGNATEAVFCFPDKILNKACWGRLFLMAVDTPAIIKNIKLTGESMQLVDYGANLQRQSQEILPVFPHPNLVSNCNFSEGMKGWKTLSGKAAIVHNNGVPALQIDNRGSRLATVASEPIKVVPGKNYLLTYVYNTSEAKFGTFSEIMLRDISDEAIPATFLRARPWGYVGGREALNRRSGEWLRRTIKFTPRPGNDEIRVIIGQSGAGARVLYRSFYFGEAAPESRLIDNSKYLNNLDPRLRREAAVQRLQKRPDSHAAMASDGSGRILIDGKITPPLIYFGDLSQPRRSKTIDFSKAGVNLQIISLTQSTHNIWKADHDYDLAKVDRLIWDNVSRNPEAYYLIRLDMTPYSNWYKIHPNDSTLGKDGKPLKDRHGRVGPPCYWSEFYRASVDEYLRRVIGHMKTRPYFRSIVGFFVSGNDDGQFYYALGKTRTLQQGTSPAAQVTFRKWLRCRYADNAALQRSWNDPNVTLDNAKTTVSSDRYPGNFLNPATQQHEIDVICFLNESMGEFGNRMCKVAKETAGKPIISVMWWGRGGELGVYPLFAQSKIVLPSKSVDLMGAQGGYWGERENGNTSIIPWVFDSVRTHGKVSVIEADSRTWVSGFKSLYHDYHCSRYWTEYDLRNVLLRESGKAFSIGGGMWWYDMDAGWFKTPEAMKIVKDIASAGNLLSNKQAVFTPAEIVFVIDEQNYYSTTEQINIWNGPNYQTIRSNQRAMMRSGLKYDCYYFNDIIERNMTGYKIYVFMNLFNISPEREKFINQKLKRDGKNLVWLYAPGYLGPKGRSEKRMSSLTGIQIRQDGINTGFADFVSGPSLTNGIAGTQAGIGLNMTGERFIVDDRSNGTVPIARYREDNKVAGAIHKFPDWNSVYMAIPSGFTPGFLQNIAKLGNAHIYNTTPGDLFMHHRDDLICLHGIEGNKNLIKLPYDATVKDLITGKPVPSAGNKVTVKLQPGETRLLYIEKKMK
jgi:hypothetical protein